MATIRNKRTVHLRRPDAAGREFIRVSPRNQGVVWASCNMGGDKAGFIFTNTGGVKHLRGADWLVFLGLAFISIPIAGTGSAAAAALDLAAQAVFGLAITAGSLAAAVTAKSIDMFIRIMAQMGYIVVRRPTQVNFTTPCQALPDDAPRTGAY